ncbi:L-rhamnose mutarotase [Microbacterium sp.]|uniref:L-rhamnose mutarotase n=1 Tax=unclassified Microbacterium TaxID=2609290 RepID=UPI002B7AD21E|nr:L-rhamnose mutarotase [Microbacterium sp.]HWK76318.1 L-rhamnose mutarotase [Microbacterium sp.]
MSSSLERVCFELRVRPERIDEYRARHAAVWPDMLRALRDTGWRNYSLFLREDGLLIGYFEAESAERAMAAMAETEVDARWQAEMAEFFDNRAGGGLRRYLEVFHLEDQLTDLAD